MSRTLTWLLASVAIAGSAQAYTYKPEHISSFPQRSPEVQQQIAKCGDTVRTLIVDWQDHCEVGTLGTWKKWVNSPAVIALVWFVALGIIRVFFLRNRGRRVEPHSIWITTEQSTHLPPDREVVIDVPMGDRSIVEIFELIRWLEQPNLSNVNSAEAAEYISYNVLPHIANLPARELTLRFKQLEVLIALAKQYPEWSNERKRTESEVNKASQKIRALIMRERSVILSEENDLQGIRICLREIQLNFFPPQTRFHFEKFMILVQHTESVEKRRTKNMKDVRNAAQLLLVRYKENPDALDNIEQNGLWMALLWFVRWLDSVDDTLLRTKTWEVLEMMSILYRISRTTDNSEAFDIWEFINILLRLDPDISELKAMQAVWELDQIGTPDNRSYPQNIAHIQKMFL